MAWAPAHTLAAVTNSSDFTLNCTTPAHVSSNSTVHKPTEEAVKWLNGLIILLGLVTNTLILVVLSGRKIVSE